MIWISHSEIIFQVAFSLDATQLLGLALSADRLAAAAVSAPLEALPQAVFFFFCAPPSVRRRLCAAVCATPPVRRAAAYAQVRTGERPTRWPTRWSHRPPAYSGGVTFTRRLSGNHLLRLLDAVG